MRSFSGRENKTPAQLEEARRQKEYEEYVRKVEQAEQLLPWKTEQKVACCLNPIKIPLIIIIGFLGTYLELKLDGQTVRTYQAGLFEHWPTCAVHKIDGTIHYNHSIFGIFVSTMDELFLPLNNWTKARLEGGTFCRTKAGTNHTECTVFETGIPSLNFTRDYCMVTPSCDIGLEGTEGAGLAGSFPFMPMALLWAIYKFVFLPVHLVDRVFNRVVGQPTPLPEPTFKLLSEPVMSNQTCNKLWNPFAKIIRVIRYQLLPNSLILPFITMRSREGCDQYVVYDVNVELGWFIYVWVIFDLVLVVVLYVLSKTAMSDCVGSWKYRGYKLWWLLTTGIPIIFFFVDLVIVLNLRFWEGLVFIMKLVVTFTWTFDFSVNVVQWLTTLNVILDVLQVAVLIATILCPVFLRRLFPALEADNEDDDSDDEFARSASRGPNLLQGASGLSQHKPLLPLKSPTSGGASK